MKKIFSLLICICTLSSLFSCVGNKTVADIAAESGYFHRNTISITSENYEVNNAMLSYFFNSQYQNMYSSLEVMGVDLTKNLKDQQYTKDMSWFDFIMQSYTIPQVEQILILCEAAKAAGFELDEHGKQLVDKAVKAIEDTAEEHSNSYGGKKEQFIRNTYGYGVTIDDIRDAIELNQLAAAYSTHISDSFNFTEDEWAEYLEEHKYEYQVIDYVSYTFEASDFADSSDARTKAESLYQAMTADPYRALKIFNTEVKTHLEEVVYADETNASVKAEKVNAVMSSLTVTSAVNDESSDFIRYAFSADRDRVTYGTADDTNGKYTVYLITTPPYIEEYLTRDIRVIALSASDGNNISTERDTIIREFVTGDKSEESFGELAALYSDDSTAHETGGLYENQGKNDLSSDEMSNWLYSPERRIGDYTSVSNGETGTNEVIYIVYYAGEGLKKWQRDVDVTMISEAYEEEFEKLEKAHKVTTNLEEAYKIPSQAGLD